MPVFSFKCSKCAREWKDLVKANSNSNCPNCGSETSAQMPQTATSVIMETPSKLQGKSIIKGISKTLKDRSAKHREKYELADQIDKHGIKDAVRLGWTKKIKRT